MQCSYCGVDNAGIANTCSACGQPLHTPTREAAAVAAAASPNGAGASAKPRGNADIQQLSPDLTGSNQGTSSGQASEDASALLERGKRLLDAGQLDQSLAAFERVIMSGDRVAEGYGWSGFVHLKRGDYTHAARQFEAALRLDPRQANAAYYLGVLAELRGSREQAQTRYRQALGIDPAHQRAQEALRRLANEEANGMVSKQAMQSNSSHGPAVGTSTYVATAEKHGVYHFLERDASPLSQETLAAIDALGRIHRRPFFSAYFGEVVSDSAKVAAGFFLIISAWEAVLQLISLAVLGPNSMAGGSPPWGWTLLVFLMAAAFASLRVYTTTITLDKGRIQIAKGIVRRSLRNIELWRVTDIELHRSLVNRLTGDGTFMLKIHGDKKKVQVTGLIQDPELEESFQRLLNITFMLRSNPAVKGIIQ